MYTCPVYINEWRDATEKKPKFNDNKARRDDVFGYCIKYANIRSSNLQIRWLTNHAQYQAKQRHDTRTKHATTAARQLVAAVTTPFRRDVVRTKYIT